MASPAKTARTPTILYVDCTPDAGIDGMRLAGLRRYAATRGWDVETLDDTDGAPKKVISGRFCCNSAHPPLQGLLPHRRECQVPVVLLDSDIVNHPHFASIRFRNSVKSLLATKASKSLFWTEKSILLFVPPLFFKIPAKASIFIGCRKNLLYSSIASLANGSGLPK